MLFTARCSYTACGEGSSIKDLPDDKKQVRPYLRLFLRRKRKNLPEGLPRLFKKV
jgi:hypothetical protein